MAKYDNILDVIGRTEVFDGYKEGRLQRLMKEKGVPFEERHGLSLYPFLPSWIHPR
jgi:hypothetical protein